MVQQAVVGREAQRVRPPVRAAPNNDLEPLDGQPVVALLSERESFLRIAGVLMLSGRRVQLVGQAGELVADLDASEVMVEGGGQRLIWKVWKPHLDVEPLR